MEINSKQEQELAEAFKSAVSISVAGVDDNHATCGSFHINPFNTHWDRKTVEEVMYHVQLYTRTWIVAPMERALGMKMAEVDDQMMLNWHRQQAHILERKITNK